MASTNRLLAAVVTLLCAVGILGATAGRADAGSRKRVVVLDFEGPHAEKFHDDVVRILKKTLTVVPVDKWNGAAEDLGAVKNTDKDIKKVAKKLKVDGVITGKIEKRRDEYLIHLKLHEGKSGSIVGEPIDTKAEGPRVDGKAQEDIKGELVEAIEALASNRGADDDEEDAKPAKKKKGGDDDEEDAKPAKKKKATDDDEEADDAPKHKGFAKHSDDARGEDKVGKKKGGDDEDDNPLPAAKKKKGADDDEDAKPAKKIGKKTSDDDEEDAKPAKKKKGGDDDEEESPRPKKKRVAKSSDDEDGVAASGDDEDIDKNVALSPGQRALDAIVGISITARRLSFNAQSDLVAQPPGYKGNPVPGAMIDATLYPFAMSHKRTDILKNFGLSFMYDRVISLKSQDPASGMTLPTTESRYAIGATFRHPFNKTAMSPVIGAGISYGGQSFTIDGNADIPNVKYTIAEPRLFIRYPASSKMTINVDAGLLLFSDTGAIQTNASYGGATVTGFEGALGLDYAITSAIFVRAAFRFETIGFKFNGTGMLTTGRDGDPEQDVFGARDNYIGGIATIGYAY